MQFTQYVPNKQDKFGFKFRMVAHVELKHMLTSFPYLGKDESRHADLTFDEHAVLRLLQPFTKIGRNVTTNKFFTSLYLSKLLKQQHISIVSTMNRIRTEIPKEIKTMKVDLHSTKAFKHNSSTLTVYCGKKNKNVLLLCTMHSAVKIGNDK